MHIIDLLNPWTLNMAYDILFDDNDEMYHY